MGHKQSTTAKWTVDDWAFGTGQNAVQMDQVFDEAKKVPAKLFGGQAIENDRSMHQMQHDLLSVDETFKRIFFRRKKNKKIEKQNYSDQYDDQYEQYDDQNEQYDEQYNDQSQQYHYQNQPSIPEEERDYASFDEEPKTITKDTSSNSSWRCKYCSTKNKSTDIECSQCRKTEIF